MNRSTIFVLVDHLPDSSMTLDIIEDGPLNADWIHSLTGGSVLALAEAYVFSQRLFFWSTVVKQ
jgi:hypothetical protein